MAIFLCQLFWCQLFDGNCFDVNCLMAIVWWKSFDGTMPGYFFGSASGFPISEKGGIPKILASLKANFGNSSILGTPIAAPLPITFCFIFHPSIRRKPNETEFFFTRQSWGPGNEAAGWCFFTIWGGAADADTHADVDAEADADANTDADAQYGEMSTNRMEQVSDWLGWMLWWWWWCDQCIAMCTGWHC